MNATAKKGSRWTEDELAYLEKKVGVSPLISISKKLGRSFHTTENKARELGLGETRKVAGKVTATELARAIGVSSTTVDNWCKNHELKYVRRRTRAKFEFTLIDIDDFWKWLYKHQKMYDSRKMEESILGPEPKWFKEKRKSDYCLPQNLCTSWTTLEIARLKTYWTRGMTVPQIVKQMPQRSQMGIRRKLDRLIKQGELEKHAKGIFYEPEEERLLIKMKQEGKSHREIANTLGRSLKGVHVKVAQVKEKGLL